MILEVRRIIVDFARILAAGVAVIPLLLLTAFWALLIFFATLSLFPYDDEGTLFLWEAVVVFWLAVPLFVIAWAGCLRFVNWVVR
jgi:hypothetical protein